MRLLLLLIFASMSVQAQSVAVKFYGTNNAAGLPPFWPQVVQPGTNAPSGFVLLTQAQLDNIIATNQPAYASWESNKTYVAAAKLSDDLADLITKLDKVETWIDKSSGTNTLSANQMNNAINDICRAFKKLRPVLRELYKPE